MLGTDHVKQDYRGRADMAYLNTHGYGSNRYEESTGSSHTPGNETRKYGRAYESPSPSVQPSTGLSLRRRGTEASTGGYGHFASGRRDTDSPAGSRSRDRGADRAKILGGGPNSHQIDDVLAHITEHWAVLKQEDCVPVQVALQLLDFSSLGRANDYQDFQRTSKQLNKAMKSIVNEHHQGFNSSIGTFHSIQASIQASQHRVRTLRDSIDHARGDLMADKPELKALGSSSQQYESALRILDQMEQLQRIPETLDGHIAEKRFLSAVEVLQDALRLLRTTEMENFGALADLRTYFTSQETSIIDILLEELHDHLYLKSPYCQTRWKSRIHLEQVGAVAWPATPAKRELEALQNFLQDLSIESRAADDDSAKNPEIDSFAYIQSLLEALSKLGQLETTVDRVEERLPVELFAIVERTSQEVGLRHPEDLDSRKMSPLALTPGEPTRGSDILEDLLQTLYAKFEAIAEAHCAMHHVIGLTSRREGGSVASGTMRGFKELWKLFQSEIRSLLHDYLATDGQQAYRIGRQPDASLNPFAKVVKGKPKHVFHITDLDPKTGDLAKDKKDLDDILEGSVPGLVIKTQRQSKAPSLHTTVPTERPAAGHRLLVTPNVYHISALLPPTLAFLARLKDIVPPDADIALSTLTSFLDDFLVNVFHPQLEETVSELCSQTFSDLEAFHEDPDWPKISPRPIFRAASNLMTLIRSFSSIMIATPSDLSTSSLLLAHAQAYLDRCRAWYRALVLKSDPVLKPAAVLAETGSIPDNKIMLEQVKNNPVTASDIISDSQTVSLLCVLHNSLEWLADQLSSSQHIVPSQQSLLMESAATANKSTQLQMTSDTAATFDGLLQSLRGLAAMALTTLCIDIRLGIAHMLSRALAANHVLEYPTQDPDPSLLALNADLMATMYTVQSHLDLASQQTIIRGLAQFMDHFIVSNSSLIITGMNENGCGLMQLNVLVLSQNLKSIDLFQHDPDVNLPRSNQLYELFAEGPDSIAARARDDGGPGLELFSLEELKALMELSYREGLQSSQREVLVKSQRELEDKLLILSECLWNR